MYNYRSDLSYEKSDQSFLKKYNIKKILSILRDHKNLSRVDIACISSLDKKTITNIVNELLENNQVQVVSKASSGAGRPKEILALNGAYAKCIGIELGGTHITGVLLDFAGKVLLSNNVDLHNDMEPDTLIQLCYHVIDLLLTKAGITHKNIEGIGISIPGFMDRECGMVVEVENFPKWHNIPIKRKFQERYHTEVWLDNSSMMMALAELRYGEGRECGNFLMIEVGLGIGCGIVFNGQVFAGSTGKSGEIGHTIVKVGGPVCTCGRRGCIESLASGWALSKNAREALVRGEKTLLRKISSSPKDPTVKEIALSAELGDAYCKKLLADAGKYIGIGIANAICFYNPRKVFIGGRLIEDNSILLQEIEKTVEEQTMPTLYKDMTLLRSNIGMLSAAIGAAALCMEKYYN